MKRRKVIGSGPQDPRKNMVLSRWVLLLFFYIPDWSLESWEPRNAKGDRQKVKRKKPKQKAALGLWQPSTHQTFRQ